VRKKGRGGGGTQVRGALFFQIGGGGGKRKRKRSHGNRGGKGKGGEIDFPSTTMEKGGSEINTNRKGEWGKGGEEKI